MSQEEISNPSASQTKPKFPFFSDNEEYWLETLRALGSSSYGAADFGEVMSTVNRIPSGDDNARYTEWNATAERVFAEAQAQFATGHRISARDGYHSLGRPKNDQLRCEAEGINHA